MAFYPWPLNVTQAFTCLSTNWISALAISVQDIAVVQLLGAIYSLPWGMPSPLWGVVDKHVDIGMDSLGSNLERNKKCVFYFFT